MKSVGDLLSELRRANIRLWAEDDRLRYSAPKGRLTPEIRDQLRERKSEILAFLHKIRPSQDEVFTPVPREGDMPLSFAQQRIWFLYQLDPEDRSYNLVWPLRLRGKLDVPALKQSIQGVIRRHEALRTTFAVRDGEPVQMIDRDQTRGTSFPVDDLCDLPESEQMETVQKMAVEGLERIFDLENDPLLRCGLLCLGPEEHVLLIFGHHMVCDSWAAGIFIRDLAAFYRAFSEDRPNDTLTLPELPIQYADFALRQREWLEKGELEKQLDYWKRQLAGAPFVLELPTDHPRPAELTSTGSLERFELDDDLARELNSLSHGTGTTLFMTLFAAFSTLIFRYTGQEDMLIGTLIANRNRKEIEHLIGLFVNTLVLRADLSGDPEFPDLVSRVRQVTLNAYAHQDIPFDQLIEAVQPPRRLSHTPLFQIVFSMQNVPLKMELPGLSMDLLDVERETAQFDLSFDMMEMDGRLTGTVEYRTDLFEADTIRRMIGHFQTLLEAIAENPRQRISELPLMTAAEQHQVLVEWNDTDADYPADKTVVDMFQEQAEKSPDKIAVVFEETQLTYRELNEQANRIAHFLTDEYQIQPDDRVGLLLERSEWMITGILGVLKAGGAYVPMDPGYPEERIQHMIGDSGCKATLSDRKLIQSLDMSAEAIDIHDIRHEFSSNPARSASPHHLAYLIYTSGSTGVPKGVLIEHRSVVNMVCGLTQVLYNRLVGGGNMKEAMTAPFVFDVSVQQIFSSLIQGNALYIISEETLLNPHLFVALLNEKSIDLIDLTPTFLSSLIESGAKLPNTIQHINLGAEQLSCWLSGKFYGYEKYLNLTIANVYGPTESCVNTALFHVDSDFRSDSPIVPIGKPMPNIRLFILDNTLNFVPIGIPGEICIAGAGLARGYLNREYLTKEKFVQNPFEPGRRMYRTGDLGRWLPDGNIEFLGRNDDQVKIRGYRIELGEIRNRLLSHNSVKNAAVIAKDFRGNEENELAAYVTGGDKLNVGELRNHIRTTLPDYMIPSYIIQMEDIPLLPSGKVDRRALPDPEGLRPDMETGYVMPRTESERRIAGVWQEALGLEKVGVHDNFFDLGGHSLLIIRVQNMLREKFGLNIPVVNLFRYPTVAALAGYLAQEDDRGEDALRQVRDRAEKQKAAARRMKRTRTARKEHNKG